MMKTPKPASFVLLTGLVLPLFVVGAVTPHSTPAPEATPTASATPSELTPTEIVPEPTPFPTEESTEEGEPSFQTLTVNVPTPPDPDCSDGECVFWVSASTNDAGPNPVSACSYRTNWNEVYLGECPNRSGIVSGFRFSGVNIPAGAQIAEAYLEFTVDGPYTDDLRVAFYGEASGNALPFSSTRRPDNRPLTQASVGWHIPASDRWELGQIRASPDLTAIVQEIVNRSDWASGNALAIIVKNASPASGPNRHRRVIGYDRPIWYPGPENAARLVVRTAREPVILLPGVGGSELKTTSAVILDVDNGHGGRWRHTYAAGEKVWVNAEAILGFQPRDETGHDDYFDILKFGADGSTPVATALTATNIVTQVTLFSVTIQNVYTQWRPFFESQGYRYGIDLFEFPYDFRKDIALTVNDLDAQVTAALIAANGGETDPSRWTVRRVNLISHSMGSKVVREYIRDPLRVQRVHRVIALGPAYLGAPKFLKALLFGDDFGTPFSALNSDEVKDIIQNWPGGLELAPSRLYWQFYDGQNGRLVPFQEDRDFDGDTIALGALTYDQLKAMLFRLDRDPYQDWDGSGRDINQTVFNMAEAFHANLDTSWDAGLPVPKVHIVAGTNICSPGQLRAYYAIHVPIPGGRRIQLFPKVDLLHVNGDGTVPLFSATLEDTTRGVDHNSNAQVYYAVGIDHGEVAVHDKVLQLVANLLRDDATIPAGLTQNQTGRCGGKVVSVESPVELHVYDGASNHTGLTALPDMPDAQPIVEEGIPGSTYEELLESKYVYLPQEGRYTIRLKATGEGTFNLRIRTYENDQITGTLLYLRVRLTPTTNGQLTYDTLAAEPPVLLLDHDGDGQVDETVAVTSRLGLGESADTQAPTIRILSPDPNRPFAGGVRVTWQASDDLAGVLNEWGIIDNETPSVLPVNNGSAVSLPPGRHTLTVLAEDRAGSASQAQIAFTVYPLEWLPPISTTEPYVAKAGRTIPVKFRVRDLAGAIIRDQSVALRLLDASGNTVSGPFVCANNPTQGVAILGDGQYHHNLRTTGLAAGTYTLQVSFNSPQLGGLLNHLIVLRP